MARIWRIRPALLRTALCAATRCEASVSSLCTPTRNTASGESHTGPAYGAVQKDRARWGTIPRWFRRWDGGCSHKDHIFFFSSFLLASSCLWRLLRFQLRLSSSTQTTSATTALNATHRTKTNIPFARSSLSLPLPLTLWNFAQRTASAATSSIASELRLLFSSTSRAFGRLSTPVILPPSARRDGRSSNPLPDVPQRECSRRTNHQLQRLRALVLSGLSLSPLPRSTRWRLSALLSYLRCSVTQQ